MEAVPFKKRKINMPFLLPFPIYPILSETGGHRIYEAQQRYFVVAFLSIKVPKGMHASRTEGLILNTYIIHLHNLHLLIFIFLFVLFFFNWLVIKTCNLLPVPPPSFRFKNAD